MEILSGRYRPGDALMTEMKACSELKVSRSAYREALRLLSAKGLIHSRSKTGTTVTPMSQWNLLDPDVLAWSFEGCPSPSLIQGMFELRLIIEPAAAAYAAERRTVDHIGEMRRALQDMEHHTLASDAGQAADRRFHDLVLEATGNPPLITLASSIGAVVRYSTAYKQRRGKLPEDPMPQHWRVFDAIAAGAPEQARTAMDELIRQALKDAGASLA